MIYWDNMWKNRLAFAQTDMINVYANWAFIFLLYRLQCLKLIKLQKVSFFSFSSRHPWAKLLLCKGSSSLGSSFACQMSHEWKSRGLTWSYLDTDPIWPTGHAKQGGRTFIRGADPTASKSTQQHTLGSASAVGCSEPLWRLIIRVTVCLKMWNVMPLQVSSWVIPYFVFPIRKI